MKSALQEIPKRRRGKGTAIAFGIALVVVLGLSYRPIASRVVTHLALQDAARVAVSTPDLMEHPDASGAALTSLAETYGFFFRQGLIDRGLLVARFPSCGMTPDALPASLVFLAYFKANESRFDEKDAPPDRTIQAFMDRHGEDVLGEFREWIVPAFASTGIKEFLANSLTGDWTMFSSSELRSAGGFKRVVALALDFYAGHAGALDRMHEFRLSETDRADGKSFYERFRAAVPPDGWEAILRDCAHPRERVRAGALLLLACHPSSDIFLAAAHTALADPSPWVRMAAAGLLAVGGHPEGEAVLLDNLAHERWEIRWWCAAAWANLERPNAQAVLQARAGREEDKWVKSCLDDLRRGVDE